MQARSEEPDGRLLLHASHVGGEGYSSVMICSEDTDVFIMSIVFGDEIAYVESETAQSSSISTELLTLLVGMSARPVVGMHAGWM